MHYKEQQEIARNLRKTPTPTEKVLWQRLRKRAICNQKFLRQVIMRFEVEANRSGFFIVDFFCPEWNLVIEVDGNVHSHQVNYDSAREKILENIGCQVLRFSNDDIFFNIDNVIQKNQFPSSGSPSLIGRGSGGWVNPDILIFKP
jgi:very-short-patch-repair endonuclease